MQSIIKHDRVSLEGEGAEVQGPLPGRAAANPKPGARCKKSVQLLREKDVVHALEVRCSCGETTLVEFEYGPARGAGA